MPVKERLGDHISTECSGWDFKVMAIGKWGDVDKNFCVVNSSRGGGFG